MKKKIITGLIIVLLPLLGLVVIGTGLLSVVDFVSSLVKDAAGVFTAGRVEKEISMADLSSYDLNKMIDVVDNETIITDDLLDEMMIERDTLIELLNVVQDYNENYDTAKKTIQAKKTYTEEVVDESAGSINIYDPVHDTWIKDTASGEAAKKKKVKKTTYVDMDYEVTAETYEKDFHQVNWQSVYITAIEETLQNYGHNYQISQKNKKGNNSQESTEMSTEGETETQEGDGGEDNETMEGEEDPSNNTIGQFKAGWSPRNNYEKKQEKKYRKWIEQYASMYNIPPDLLRAIITTESSWNPKVTSSAGAHGLCQFMPAAWLDYGVKMLGYKENDVWEPEPAIHACARLIAEHIKAHDGDVILALTAYNAGAGNVNKWIANGTINTEIHMAYAAKVISSFTGYKYTGAQFAAGNYIGGAKLNVSVGFGTLDSDGRVSLTTQQIDELIYQFETKFEYEFDVVRDSETYYDYNKCQTLPNYGEKTSGDPDTEEGQLSWYEPVSSLSKAETIYMDVNYTTLNVLSDYVIRLDRWEGMERFYWPHYDGKWFKTLVKLMPNGKVIPDTYDYYASIASSIIEYDKDNPSSGFNSTATTGGTGVASGNYKSLECVTPSIKIPSNCGGMGIPLYLQYDSRWGGRSFGGGTIASSGCGATSAAMVLSYLLKKSIYPDDIVDVIGNRYYVAGEGQSWAMVPGVCKTFGCRAVQQTVNADAIVASLKAGHPVIVSTDGNGTTQEFTKHGHYIVLRGLTDDGKVLVNDPNDNATTKKHYQKAYTPQFIYSECCRNGSPKVMYTIYGPGE